MRFTVVLLILLTAGLACGPGPLPDKGFIDVPGARLHYRTLGEGEPLLVLHGGPGFDHQTFLPQLERLARRHRVIFYDQRGGGFTEGAVDSSTIDIDVFVADIEAVRRAFGLEQLNLLGHSWGGVLALHYAVAHPERLRTLIVASAGASSDCFDVMRDACDERRPEADWRALDEIYNSRGFRLREPSAVADFWRVYFRVYFPEPGYADSLNLKMTQRTIDNGETVAKLMLASVGDFDLHEALGRVDCPALVIHGAADPLPPRYAERIHESLPGSELLILENVGHWLFVDGQAPFCDGVADFLARHAR